MLTLRLALRNIMRQRRRTVLTLLVLVTGYVGLAMAGGFISQSFSGLADGAIHGGIGHFQILDTRTLEGDEAQSLEFAIPDGEKLAELLRMDNAVLEVLPRIEFMGLATADGRSIAFMGTGVDPVREPVHMACLDQVKDGSKAPGGEGSRWLSADPGSMEVLLGVGLARSLGVSVGDDITLLATTQEGTLNAVDAEVAGLLDLGLKEANDRFLTVSCHTANSLLDSDGARSRLSVLLKNPKNLEKEMPRLSALVGHPAKPWTELATFYRQVKLLYLAIFGFMGIVLGFVVVLSTANALLMSVMERVREFGTLRALGMQPKMLFAMVQLEGAMLGIIGSAAGLAVTMLLRLALNSMHIQLPAPPGLSHGYELNIHFVPLVYLLSFLGLQLAVQISAWLPARRSAKLSITEALRHV